MENKKTVIDVKDLEDTEAVEKLCKEEGTIYVSENGLEKFVLIDYDVYKKAVADTPMAEKLKELEETLEKERAAAGNESFE